MKAGVSYELPQKWSAELQYFFLEKGENDFGIFDSKKNDNGYYVYYPRVSYEQNKTEENYDKELARARNMWISGLPMYVNQISLEGKYAVNNKLSGAARTIYTFIFNAGHQKDRFAHGVEFDISLTYTLF